MQQKGELGPILTHHMPQRLIDTPMRLLDLNLAAEYRFSSRQKVSSVLRWSKLVFLLPKTIPPTSNTFDDM